MSYLIYGANGFTGRLIAKEAARRGHDFVIGGRNAAALEPLGCELQRSVRVFSLGDPAVVRSNLQNIDAVLHCAGPFEQTSRPMVTACLTAGAHYLDITGEISVFEAVMARDAEARARGVALIPGVGFDVVPTDCVAAQLRAALPDALDLKLAFFSPGARISRGTFRTMIQSLGDGGAVRRNGTITGVPIDYDVREIDFSCGSRMTMSLPWGDVSSAFHSTGIPNVTVYAGRSPREIKRIRRLRPLLPLMKFSPLKKLALMFADRMTGPDEEARRTGRVYVWGEATSSEGASVVMRLSTVEAYEFTVRSALAAIERTLAGVSSGALTPSRAFGVDFVNSIPGTDVEPPTPLKSGRQTG